MKKILFVLAIGFLLTSFQSNCYGEVYHKIVEKSGGGGPWYCLWCHDMYDKYVHSTETVTDEFGVTHIFDHYQCTGGGNVTCNVSMVKPGTGFPDGFIESSALMMDRYVTDQGLIGNYSGNQDFNVIVDEVLYYRNVIWQGNANFVHINMTIFPESELQP